MRLVPSPMNEMYGRDGFLIHGDHLVPDKLASDGEVDALIKSSNMPQFQGMNVIQHGPHSATEGPHIHIDSRNASTGARTYMHEGMQRGVKGYFPDAK